jgi:hypothetical protein
MNIYFNTDEKDEPIWQDTFEYGVLHSEWNANRELYPKDKAFVF